MRREAITGMWRLGVPCSAHEAERITRYLDARTDAPKCADLVFVFGTRHLEPGYLAAELVKEGIGRFVVVTGGKNRLTGVREANALLQVILERGVPRNRVLSETESTNTRENVMFALPEIAKCFTLEELKSVVVVTKWYHSRRAMMTLKRHMPEGIRYYAVTYEPAGIGRSDWWQDGEAARRVVNELGAIPKYLELGHIAAVREESGAYV